MKVWLPGEAQRDIDPLNDIGFKYTGQQVMVNAPRMYHGSLR